MTFIVLNRGLLNNDSHEGYTYIYTWIVEMILILNSKAFMRLYLLFSKPIESHQQQDGIKRALM